MNEKMTWSPLANSVTPSPAFAQAGGRGGAHRRGAVSEERGGARRRAHPLPPPGPGRSGGGGAIVPVIAERSEWHTPHAPRRTVPSPRLGASRLISSTTTGLLCSRQRAAFALRGIARKYSWIQ